MKLYVLDDNGAVVFEYSDTNIGTRVSAATKARVIMLLNAALKFLQLREK